MKKLQYLGKLTIVSAATIFVLTQPARAILIQPDTATASSEFSSGYLATNTINGSGLPSGFDISDTHANYAVGNHWTSATGTTPTDQFISWGFITPQTLDTIYIWNHLSSQPLAANTGYDVTLFDLTLLNSSGGTLLSLNDAALTPDTNTSQSFSFGGAIPEVATVIFDVETVQSSPNFTGLAEVAFNSTDSASVPFEFSPAFGLLLMCSFFGVSRYIKSRKADKLIN